MFLKVPSTKNGLSFVAKHGRNETASIILEQDDSVQFEPKQVGTKEDPIKILGKPVVFCALCGNQGPFCHNIRYGCDCLKAVYAYLHNSTKVKCFGEGFTGCSKETITDIFVGKYNTKHQSDLEERFNFHNTNWMTLPECMKRKSLKQAIGIMHNLSLVEPFKAENKQGYQCFY